MQILDRPLCRNQLPFGLLPTICEDPWGPFGDFNSTSKVKREGFVGFYGLKHYVVHGVV